MHTSSSKPFFTIQTYEDRNNAINRELNLKISERLSAAVLPPTQQREEVLQDKPLTQTSAATPKVPPVAPLRTTTNTINNALKTKETEGGDTRLGTLVSTTGVYNAPPPPPFPVRELSRPTSAPVVAVPKLNTPPSPHQMNGFHNTNNNGTIRSKTKAPPPPVPIKTSVLSHLQPPPCPTPDYDTLSLNSNNATLSRNGKLPTTSQRPTNGVTNDSVEMESLDSFKLNKPYDATPRPPSTYFHKTKQNGIVQNGNAHIMASGAQEKKPRPVSVTIGEYPSGTTRKAPGKFDFLQQRDNVDGKKNGNTQFASELAMTLSRSNLRKRTESMANGN